MKKDYRNYVLKGREKLAFTAVCCILAGAAGILFYNRIYFAAAGILFYRKFYELYCEYRGSRIRKEILLEFRDFLYSISSSFATGRHMDEAMEEYLGFSADSENTILRGEVENILRKREAGETVSEGLMDFAERSGLEDIRNFVTVYSICRETGGNLTEAVNRAASVTGEKISIEQEIRALTSARKAEGRMITAMPVMIIVFMRILSPGYLDIMYTTAAGRLIMTLSLGIIVFAWIMTERITDIEI